MAVLEYDPLTGVLKGTGIRIKNPTWLEGDTTYPPSCWWEADVEVFAIPTGFYAYRVMGHGTGYGSNMYMEECLRSLEPGYTGPPTMACEYTGVWRYGAKRRRLWGIGFDVYLQPTVTGENYGDYYLGSFNYALISQKPPPPPLRYSLTLAITPTMIMAGDPLHFTGRLLQDDTPLADEDVQLWGFYPLPSPQEWQYLGIDFTTDENGEFSEDIGTPGLLVGTYRYKARYFY